MELNPLNSECQKLRRELAELNDKQQQLERMLEWYRSTSVEQLTADLQINEQKVQQLRRYLSQLDGEIVDLSERLRDAESQLGSWLNPFNWFSPQQRTLRADCGNLRTALSKKQEQYAQAKSQLATLETHIRQLDDQLEQYRAFDVGHHERRLAELRHQIALKEDELSRLSEQQRQLDQKLQPLYDKIKALEKEKQQVKSDLEAAKCFQDRLDKAPDSRTRYFIHQECLEKLRCEKPRDIIAERRQRLRTMERDLEKLNQRIDQEISAFLRKSAVEDIIIDGNNLCYEDGCFIGLAALKVLVPELVKNHFQVVVVFDASIRWKLKTADRKVQQKLSPATVHIVNGNQPADHLILQLASQNERAYVLSNDRFADHPDSPVVQAGRLIRHEIVNNHIYIRDLQICLTYHSA